MQSQHSLPVAFPSSSMGTLLLHLIGCKAPLSQTLLGVRPYECDKKAAIRWTGTVSTHAMQVFAKGAKFSMFKPAEEMVYIGLDEQSRTKGKAAIDVAGAQTGKSMGSVLQQVKLTHAISAFPGC